MNRALIACAASLVIAASPAGAATKPPLKTAAQAQHALRSSHGDVWWLLSSRERQLVAAAYLSGPGRRYSQRVTAASLIAELARPFQRSVAARFYAGTQSLQATLGDAAMLANATAIGKARREWLPSKQLVGKPLDEVRVLIGPPDHTQEIMGLVGWLYNLGDNMYQLLSEDGVVTEQNMF